MSRDSRGHRCDHLAELKQSEKFIHEAINCTESAKASIGHDLSYYRQVKEALGHLRRAFEICKEIREANDKER